MLSERERANATAARLQALWQSSLPGLRGRIGLLEVASAAAAAGRLSEGDRLEAGSTAHKLAGSLGTFGYPDGTTISRRIEAVLNEDSPEPTSLARLVAALRKALPLDG